jgi:hypothetical protein
MKDRVEMIYCPTGSLLLSDRPTGNLLLSDCPIDNLLLSDCPTGIFFCPIVLPVYTYPSLRTNRPVPLTGSISEDSFGLNLTDECQS